jgi:hypothetical protein
MGFRVNLLLLIATAVSSSIGADITWAIPSFDIEFCPLTPPRPCPEYRVDFIVNQGTGPYVESGGKDIRCRAVEPFDKVISDWQKCDDESLEWRWEQYEDGKISPSGIGAWPKDKDGYSHIGLKQNANSTEYAQCKFKSYRQSTNGQHSSKSVLTSTFTFRETSEVGLSSRPDAVLGCVVYNPRAPLKCSMNDLIVFGALTGNFQTHVVILNVSVKAL